MKKQTLKDILLDDDISPPELAILENLLRQAPEPQPRPAHQAQVLAAMASLLPRRQTCFDRWREWYPLLLLFSQVSILRREIWPASALVLSLGLLVTLTTPRADTLLFSALAPIVAAVGVAALYGDITRSMLEIEETTRTSGPILLLARLTLVFGYNLGLGLVGSGVLVLCHSELVLVPFIMSWLAPMTFLCGLAFFLSLTTADPLLSASSSLLLWILHLGLRHIKDGGILLQIISLPGLSDPASRPMLVVAGCLMVAAAVGLLEIKNRYGRNPL